MLVDISDVLLNTGKVKKYTIKYGLDSFSYKNGDYRVVSSEPFEIEVVSPDKNKLNIRGQGEIFLAIPCNRCLTDVDTIIDISIDEEIDMDTDVDEQNFVEGHNIDVDKMLETELLLNIPGKVLCNEDCKGICTVCGKNLNEGECGCDRFVPDPRMAAINDIFDKFSK